MSGPIAGQLAKGWNRGAAPLPRQAWHADYVSIDGDVLDDVVFCLFCAPRSYTAEDVLEISSHGNPFIVNKILEDLRRRGCRLAEPGEFTKRAFLNGRLDLTEAEAVMDLIRARSDRALATAQRQLRGALRERVDEIVRRLLDLSATIEAQVDFPEEDLPDEDRSAWLTATGGMVAELKALAATRHRGELLREGANVVLIGEPNAGKSSLFNRLVGYERAIVSEEPGTTRDFLEARLEVGGWSIRLYDTAGLRSAAGAVERAGVQRTLERVSEADLLVWVLDASRPAPPLPPVVLDRMQMSPTVVALNKCDLPDRAAWPTDQVPPLRVEVSALTGAGVSSLEATLTEQIEKLAPAFGNDGVAVNSRHEACLVESGACLARVAELLTSSPALELVAIELRAAADALSGIVGRIDREKVLDRLFASFCIGK